MGRQATPSGFRRFAWAAGAADWMVADGHAAPGLDPIREAMLHLAAGLRGGRATVLAEAIGGGRSLPELFELRRPLVHALTTDHGELHALRQMMRVDAMFLAAWPEAPVTRPADLG